MAAKDTEDIDQSANSVGILPKSALILDCLFEHGELSVAEIAEYTNQPVSSAYRLLRGLVALDWIEAGSKRGSYKLGLYFVKIAGLTEGHLDLQMEARSTFRAYRHDTLGTWSLFVRNGLQSVCILTTTDLALSRFSLEVGQIQPLDLGAPSQILMAFLPRLEYESIFEQLQYMPTRNSALSVSLTRFREEMRAIRAHGFVVDKDETASGVVTISAPVFNYRSEVIAASCLSGLPSGLLERPKELKKTQALTTKVAAEISARMGFQEEAFKQSQEEDDE